MLVINEAFILVCILGGSKCVVGDARKEPAKNFPDILGDSI
jgi:hypothetical protein